MPYALEALAFFRQKGLPLALATSTGRTETMIKLQILGLTDFFKVVYCREDVENRKPHPEIYVKTAASLGFKPEECLVFEDTVVGVIAAKRAGCFVIAVPNMYTKHLDFSKADKMFGNLRQAVAWLKKHLLK